DHAAVAAGRGREPLARRRDHAAGLVGDGPDRGGPESARHEGGGLSGRRWRSFPAGRVPRGRPPVAASAPGSARKVPAVGNAGSGETTAGRVLAQRLAVPFVEVDAVYGQPGWTPLPVEQ